MEKTQAGRSVKSVETRNAILLAARVIFVEKGIEQTRISDITEKAKVSHGTFYNYFENKEAILHEVIRPILDELYDAATVSWNHGDIRTSVEFAIRSFLEIYSRNADVIRILKEGVMTNKILKHFWFETRRRFTRRILKNLEDVAAMGQLRDIDMHIAAAAFGITVDGFAYYWYCDKSPEIRHDYNMDELCKSLTNLWCNALYITETV